MTEMYGLTFSNIPILNLRREFNRFFEFLHSSRGEEAFKPPIQPIESPYMVWLGMPDDFATLLLQRALLGIESYLPFALMITAGKLGTFTNEFSHKLRNPFSFGARNLAINLYDRAPAAVHPELSLAHLDQSLFQKTLELYKEVRNPIFHGKQISRVEIGSLREVYNHVARLYEWVDIWHDPGSVMEGAEHLKNIRKAVQPKT
ncbi:MAG: hypothetical protein ABJM11_16665 [Marinobacter sp.]|uniref:hypothetical protein n=1 Tax=Marinobacter sp. TaxID=50741 RepID=UPI0032999F51